MRDSIVFPKESFETALSFYIEALSEGIVARWRGQQFIEGLDSYYVVEIDAEKTIELKNKEV
jgi:hypothetical protein